MSDLFKLAIKLDHDTMRTADDIATALETVAADLRNADDWTQGEDVTTFPWFHAVIPAGAPEPIGYWGVAP